jgi:hypothetical protein
LKVLNRAAEDAVKRLICWRRKKYDI